MRLNPIKEARLAYNLTQKELAKLAGITPNALIKNEHGLYPEPSTKIIAALASFTESSNIARLTIDYKKWRAERLIDAQAFFKYHRAVVGLNPTGGVNPFVCWRVHHLHLPNRMEFCKLLVLHPATVQKYEQGEMRQMPESIYIALTSVLVSHDAINYLNYLGVKYYDRIHHAKAS